MGLTDTLIITDWYPAWWSLQKVTLKGTTFNPHVLQLTVFTHDCIWLPVNVDASTCGTLAALEFVQTDVIRDW
jgi:hypothetical protein